MKEEIAAYHLFLSEISSKGGAKHHENIQHL